MLTPYAPLAATLDREIAWFATVLDDRLRRTAEGTAAGPPPISRRPTLPIPVPMAPR